MGRRVLQFHRHGFNAMGSPCEVQLFAADPGEASAAAQRVIDDVARLESRYSRYRDDSLLSGMNRVARAGGRCTVDEETSALLDYAATCHAQSDGLFDITSGILRQAWRFDAGQLPDPALIEELRTRVGWHRVRWRRPTIEFTTPGMEMDFGGIVKEYAADRAAILLLDGGIAHAVVNLGGDIRVTGPRADGSPWKVGIRHPRNPGGLLRSVEMRGGALATSGDYERCIVIDGVRYGHILNPRTGWPVRRMAAVSVMADLCVVAGSAATVTMLREDAGPKWLAGLGLACLCVDVDGNVSGPLAGKQAGKRSLQQRRPA